MFCDIENKLCYTFSSSVKLLYRILEACFKDLLLFSYSIIGEVQAWYAVVYMSAVGGLSYPSFHPTKGHWHVKTTAATKLIEH